MTPFLNNDQKWITNIIRALWFSGNTMNFQLFWNINSKYSHLFCSCEISYLILHLFCIISNQNKRFFFVEIVDRNDNKIDCCFIDFFLVQFKVKLYACARHTSTNIFFSFIFLWRFFLYSLHKYRTDKFRSVAHFILSCVVAVWSCFWQSHLQH